MSRFARRPTLIHFSILAIVGLAGCGGRGGGGSSAPDTRPLAKVAGQVVAEGKAIDGTGLAVLFQPQDGTPHRVINLAPDGSFSGEAIAGMNKVILGVGAGAGAHDDGTRPGIQPGYLSSESPLTADVKAGGENKFTFDVGVPIAASGN